jgi:patatin-like phospholipase/acyl hydrolase
MFVPESCHVCGQSAHGILIREFPETSRLRVLSIDGGGIRGSAPIGFLKAMQDEIGIPYYNVQRSFDVKVGTSSGEFRLLLNLPQH